MKLLLSLFILTLSMTAWSQRISTPAWLQKDITRKARWLPSSIKNQGLDLAYQQRVMSLPGSVQSVLAQLSIPKWMVALIPIDANSQDEINKQISGMLYLAGSAPTGRLAQRAEQLLLFGGAAQLPTPGDNKTGVSLGAEGCTAAMAKYVLAQLKLEFPNELASLPENLATSQSSVEMKRIFQQLAASGAKWFDIQYYPFAQLKAQNVSPGSIMIGQKPGGTHVFGWTRVLGFWGWSSTAKMAIGNTGLPQFGSRMILAQEYITEDPNEYTVNSHNEHGPINSNNVVRANGQPILSDPRTNVYAAQGSDFIVINLH